MLKKIIAVISLIFICLGIFNNREAIADGWQGVWGSDVRLDTANFNNNLGPLDETVQDAMETLDEMAGGGSTNHAALNNLGYANSNHTGFEASLGNPTANGYILSSNTDGVRSWVENTGSGNSTWGGITGNISNQTDLQGELDNKASLTGANFSGDITTTGLFADTFQSGYGAFNYSTDYVVQISHNELMDFTGDSEWKGISVLVDASVSNNVNGLNNNLYGIYAGSNGTIANLTQSAFFEKGGWDYSLNVISPIKAVNAEFSGDVTVGGEYVNSSTIPQWNESYSWGNHANQGYANTNNTRFGINSVNTGENSAAYGDRAQAEGYHSLALGYNTYVGTEGSIAIGSDINSYLGIWPIAIGYNPASLGNYSLAIGYSPKAYGDYSSAIGYYANSATYGCTSVGMYGLDTGNSTSDIRTDPAFIVGNGTDSGNLSNAFVVTKDGRITKGVWQSTAISSSNVSIATLGTPTYTKQYDFNNSFGSCGRKSGGEITNGSSSNVSVAAGTGFIKATDDDDAELMSFNWSANTNVPIPANSTRYIGVEYNGGNPQVVARTSFDWNLDSEFPLGRVVNDYINGANELYSTNIPWWVTDGMTNITEVIRSFGMVRRDETIGGLILSVTGTRNVSVTSGVLWSSLNEYSFGGLDTSSSGTFEYYWYKAGTGWQASDATQFSVTQWNDTTAAALQTINNNKYCNIWVYGENDSGTMHIAILYPQAEYNTAAEAQATASPSLVPSHISEMGKLLGRIIIKQGVDAPVSVQTVFTTNFSSSVSTTHNNLAGLQGGTSNEYYHLTSSQYTESTRNSNSTVNGLLSSGDWGNFNSTYSIVNGNAAAWTAKEPAISAGTTAQYWRGDKSWQTLNATSVGLGAVENAAASGLYVPLTRTVNSKSLSADISLAASDIGLGNVENTALSTWAGTANITTVGTIATGAWGGTAIAQNKLTKKIDFTFIAPATMPTRDMTPIYYNNSGSTLVLTSMNAVSNANAVNFSLVRYPAGNFNAVAATTLLSANINTAGNNCYYNATSSFANANVTNNTYLAVDFDNADAPSYLSVSLNGGY